MLARIRKAMDEKDEGFTLIELLVVMIIIGILAAIAIPVFLNQRKNAVDASIKSDLRTYANEVESVYTDTEAYPAALPTGVRTSGVNKFTYVLNGTKDAFCVAGVSAKGTHGWAYMSNLGGLQPAATTDCSTF